MEEEGGGRGEGGAYHNEASCCSSCVARKVSQLLCLACAWPLIAPRSPSRVVVFVLGGVTYAEARALDRAVEANCGTGTCFDVSGKPITFDQSGPGSVTSGVGADGTTCYLGGTSILDTTRSEGGGRGWRSE